MGYKPMLPPHGKIVLVCPHCKRRDQVATFSFMQKDGERQMIWRIRCCGKVVD